MPRQYGRPNGQNGGQQRKWAADATSSARRALAADVVDVLDANMGFDRFDAGPSRVGWLINFAPTSVTNADASPGGAQAVNCYFLDAEGGYFKATLRLDPYFFVKCLPGTEGDVEEWLKRALESCSLKETVVVNKDDLSMPGHLLGAQQSLVQLRFWNTQDLVAARRVLQPLAEANQRRLDQFGNPMKPVEDAQASIVDLREHDVPYHVRLAIDRGLRVGKWYTVEARHGMISLNEREDLVHRPDPVVLAFDIETTKAPLKFPDAAVDQVMMISYMIDGAGFLITNREIVSQDIADFEYTPVPEYHGEFTVFNEADERAVLERFFAHVREEKPTVIATFNGDFFDWPFVDARAAVHGLSLYEELGFRPESSGADTEYRSTHCCHMDCFRWVKRDSYLPQGSQGLKAVTKAKLGYNPLELSPELMTPYAQEKPQVLAEYSVSDAVATYYLYMKYVHPFVFSLCTIVPLPPDEVLRKGTGTLCEMLLMVQAYDHGIVLPHKHRELPERFYDGHLVESETYVGGHVESLESGVFRSDLETDFSIEPGAVDELLAQLDAALTFTITVEHGKRVEDCTNLEEVRFEIASRLEALRDRPKRTERPLIYHVDVASMYPNIMTTNRLQPDSIKTERDCALCDFNEPGKQCDRRLPWSWRGEFYPAKRDEVLMIQAQLRRERFPAVNTVSGSGNGNGGGNGARAWDDLGVNEQAALTKKRVADYSRTVYHRLRETETVEREAIVCQRENPFYVDTVRAFRDRRYEFKGLAKQWKQRLGAIPVTDAAGREEAAKMVVLYDSMQLAHKCILNSFYGYVMRKGSRWYSMEMAGVTCLTGATIIQLARGLVERLGRPLELDTDGIWCILPASFPGDLTFQYKNGKSSAFAYPCTMLNHLVHERFTNHQYQTLVDPENHRYEVSSDNTILFEVDGPYRCMMLPSSREEGKGLKKRYAVFNEDGTLAELKGFELKRRGELQVIKAFQDQVFSRFLAGESLEQCYAAVAGAADAWLDVLETRGAGLEDTDLLDLISENKSMSKALADYGAQKSTSICTARRLAEFLGAQMGRDSGLACQFVISSEPASEPVTNRAVPVAIFRAAPPVRAFFLRKWLKKPGLETFDVRSIVDWGYYRERLAAAIQKIVTIPAARQGLANPVPRVAHPPWVLRQLSDPAKTQRKISFTPISREQALKQALDTHKSLSVQDHELVDIEDTMANSGVANGARKRAIVRKPMHEHGNIPDSSVLAVPEGEEPDPAEDYVAWLAYMKPVWAKRRLQRQQRRRVLGEAPRGVVHGLLADQAQRSFGGGHWQLLQVRDAGAGRARAFVWINGRIHSVFVNVPRRVYVEMRPQSPHTSYGTHNNLPVPSHWQLCDDWLLPDGRTAPGRLYRVEQSEDAYQDSLAAADSPFKRPDVAAVHEARLSPVDRVVQEIGASCLLSDAPGLLGRGLARGFELGWLRSTAGESAASSYLDGTLDYVLVQHFEVHGRRVAAISTTWSPRVLIVHDSGEGWGPWTVASDYAALGAVGSVDASVGETETLAASKGVLESVNVSSNTNMTIVDTMNGVSVDPSMKSTYDTDISNGVVASDDDNGTVSDTTKSNGNGNNGMKVNNDGELNGTLGEEVNGDFDDDINEAPISDNSHIDGGIEVNAISVPSQQFWGTLTRELTQLHGQRGARALAVVQSNRPARRLLAKVRPLSDVFATLVQPASQWTPPAVGWQPALNRRIAKGLLRLPHWLARQRVKATWSHVPVGNLPSTDDMRELADILYARRLHQTRNLLWWNSPDSDAIGSHSGAFFNDDGSGDDTGEINRETEDVPGLYDGVCLDFSVGNVAVNAVLAAPLLTAAEGTEDADGADALASDAFSAPAWRSLVTLVREWWAQAAAATDEAADVADCLVEQFSGWVLAPGRLHSTRLAHQLRTLAYKARSQLGAELRRLGMAPVHSSTGRLILATSKPRVEAAFAFGAFAVRAVKANPLFTYLDIQVADYWDWLAWHDATNWCGRVWKDMAADDHAVLENAAHWRISAALPPLLRAELDDWTFQLMHRINGEKDSGTSVNFTGVVEFLEAPLVARVRQLQTRYLDSRADPMLAAEFVVPQQASLIDEPTNTMLEFVKAVMAVYGLGDSDRVLRLRRKLLAALGVGAFDPAADNTSAGATLVIRDVICTHCHDAVAVDIGEQDRSEFRFACPRCRSDLDRVYLEERLVEMLVELVGQYQLQDLRCSRCGRVRPNDLQAFCTCSGSWTVAGMGPETVAKRAKVFGHVARFYGLRLLETAHSALVL